MASPYLGQFQQPRPGGPAVTAPRGRAPRTTYSLHYEDDRLGLAKRVEFEAGSAAYALEIAVAEVEGRHALLLEEGRPVCRLVKASPGESPYWIIAAGEASTVSQTPISPERNS